MIYNHKYYNHFQLISDNVSFILKYAFKFGQILDYYTSVRGGFARYAGLFENESVNCENAATLCNKTKCV